MSVNFAMLLIFAAIVGIGVAELRWWRKRKRDARYRDEDIYW